MAAHHTVGVQHGDELEDEHAAQGLGARVVPPQDEGQEAVEHERRRRLPRVHAAAEEEHLRANRIQRVGRCDFCCELFCETRLSLLVCDLARDYR